MDGEAETDEDRVLAQLGAEIAGERETIASLTGRARVLEVETRNWVSPASRERTTGWFVLGFLLGSAAGAWLSALLLCWTFGR